MNRSAQLALLKKSIINVPNYPKPGVLFRDITGLLADPTAFALAIQLIVERYRNQGITKVAGTEARGFLFGAPVALLLNVGFIPIRKAGKLPRATYGESYQLEYGKGRLEMHESAITAADRVLVVDDLLATGGTIDATVRLIRRAGGTINDAAFVINLFYLNGEARLKEIGIESYSLLRFSGQEE